MPGILVSVACQKINKIVIHVGSMLRRDLGYTWVGGSVPRIGSRIVPIWPGTLMACSGPCRGDPEGHTRYSGAAEGPLWWWFDVVCFNLCLNRYVFMFLILQCIFIYFNIFHWQKHLQCSFRLYLGSFIEQTFPGGPIYIVLFNVLGSYMVHIINLATSFSLKKSPTKKCSSM